MFKKKTLANIMGQFSKPIAELEAFDTDCRTKIEDCNQVIHNATASRTQLTDDLAHASNFKANLEKLISSPLIVTN